MVHMSNPQGSGHSPLNPDMFDSCTCALLVQLVERRSPKPDVGGSSPPGRASTSSS
jgi:hypothetical protein